MVIYVGHIYTLAERVVFVRVIKLTSVDLFKLQNIFCQYYLKIFFLYLMGVGLFMCVKKTKNCQPKLNTNLIDELPTF
jgi:hypothetical protein